MLKPTRSNNFNVLLIISDALRADHLDLQQGQNCITPNLSSFSRESINFTNAISQGISTAPSMTSILTSTYPLDYGGHWFLHEERKTLAEYLKEVGFNTAAIHSNPNVSRLRNFHRGFDHFEENLLPWGTDFFSEFLPDRALQWGNKLFRLLRKQPYLSAKTLNRKILSWQKNVEFPFFIWSQYMDTHGPYLSHNGFSYLDKLRAERLWRKAAVKNPEGVTEEEKRELRDSYRAEVSYMDDQFGKLMRDLKDRNAWKDTLVIFTSDHGDEFGEHGLYGHKNKPYEELIRVPLMMKFPEGWEEFNGTTVDTTVRLIDILPTVLDLVGCNTGSLDIQGVSLLPLLEKGEVDNAPEYVVTEKEVKGSDALRVGLRTDAWKFIMDGVNDNEELYHLEEDPGEQNDVSEEYPDKLEEFRSVLKDRFRQLKETSENIKVPDLKEAEEVKSRLRDLGYL